MRARPHLLALILAASTAALGMREARASDAAMPPGAERPPYRMPLRGEAPSAEIGPGEPGTPPAAALGLRGSVTVRLGSEVPAAPARRTVTRRPARPWAEQPGSEGLSLDPSAAPISLRGSVDYALAGNALIKAADADARAAEAAVMKQWFSFLPVVAGNVGLTRLYNDTGQFSTNRFSSGLRTEGYAGASLQWPIFNGFQNYFGLRSAQSTSLAAGMEADATRGDIVLGTVNAYLGYVAADRSVGLLAKNIAMLERLSVAVQARLQAGFSSEADLSQVEADLAGLRQQLVSLQGDRAKAQSEVSSLTGHAVRPRGSFPKLARQLARGREALVAEAVNSNPRLQAARYTSEAAGYASRATFGRYLPQISAVGAFQRDIDRNVPTGIDSARPIDRNSWNLGIQLQQPIVDLGTMADVRQSIEAAGAAAFRADDARRQVELQIRTLWTDYVAGEQRWRLAHRRSTAQRKVSEAWEEQFKLGLISLDALLTRQRLLTTAELEEQQADMARYATMSRLLVVAGVFSPSMLDL